MTGRKRLAGLTLGGLAAGVAASLWAGTRTQKRSLADLLGRLDQGMSLDSSAPLDLAVLADLPMPAARYLQSVLQDGQPLLRRVYLEQTGTIRTDPESGKWMPFRAKQEVAPLTSAFVWNARVAVQPFLHVRVRDAFVGGRGSGKVSFLSALPMGGDSGHLQIDLGAMHRYLAEAVWYPTALLPSDSLRWSPVSENSAMVTLDTHGLSVSLELRFNEAGEVVSIYTPARWGNFGGTYKQAGWEARVSGYQQVDGIRVPTIGEVGWYRGKGWRPVWRGEVTRIAFERI